jgi:hypothetical protein
MIKTSADLFFNKLNDKSNFLIFLQAFKSAIASSSWMLQPARLRWWREWLWRIMSVSRQRFGGSSELFEMFRERMSAGKLGKLGIFGKLRKLGGN